MKLRRTKQRVSVFLDNPVHNTGRGLIFTDVDGDYRLVAFVRNDWGKVCVKQCFFSRSIRPLSLYSSSLVTKTEYTVLDMIMQNLFFNFIVKIPKHEALPLIF